jgi:hypothetical protein
MVKQERPFLSLIPQQKVFIRRLPRNRIPSSALACWRRLGGRQLEAGWHVMAMKVYDFHFRLSLRHSAPLKQSTASAVRRTADAVCSAWAECLCEAG